MKIEGKGKLADLIHDLLTPLESVEFRLKILDEDFKERGSQLLTSIEIYTEKMKGWSVAPNNYEGIRIKCDKENGDGWFLLRMSLHDPVMPLNIESESNGGVELIRVKLVDFFASQEGIDVSVLTNFKKK